MGWGLWGRGDAPSTRSQICPNDVNGPKCVLQSWNIVDHNPKGNLVTLVNVTHVVTLHNVGQTGDPLIKGVMGGTSFPQLVNVTHVVTLHNAGPNCRPFIEGDYG